MPVLGAVSVRWESGGPKQRLCQLKQALYRVEARQQCGGFRESPSPAESMVTPTLQTRAPALDLVRHGSPTVSNNDSCTLMPAAGGEHLVRPQASTQSERSTATAWLNTSLSTRCGPSSLRLERQHCSACSDTPPIGRWRALANRRSRRSGAAQVSLVG
jgi:hypothetical protein